MTADEIAAVELVCSVKNSALAEAFEVIDKCLPVLSRDMHPTERALCVAVIDQNVMTQRRLLDAITVGVSGCTNQV